jgi:hypothetical protein
LQQNVKPKLRKNKRSPTNLKQLGQQGKKRPERKAASFHYLSSLHR